MKKIICVLVTILLFAASCKKTDVDDEESTEVPLSAAAQELKDFLDAEFAEAVSRGEGNVPDDAIWININIDNEAALDNNKDPIGILFDAIPYNKYVIYDFSESTFTELGDTPEEIAEARRGKPFVVEIVLPDFLERIGDYNFYKLSGLTDIVIPDTVISIGKYAFYDCVKLESTFAQELLPADLEQLDDYALARCTSFIEIEIPAGVKNIANGLLSGCTSLAEIKLGANVESIGDYAFAGCSEITAPPTNIENVTSIGTYAFASCSSLTSFTVPLLQKISQGLFSDCRSLSLITFDNAALITRIDSYAFYKCTKLQTITIPPNIITIADYTFADCTELGKPLAAPPFTSAPSGITIPLGVTKIGNSAFINCVNLYDVIFETTSPALKTIADNAFSGCIKLGAFEKSNPPSQPLQSIQITLPDTVTDIGNYAFYRCQNLSAITFSSALKTIGDSAFADCVRFYKNLTSPTSTDNSFTIPDSLTSIGSYAFRGCGGISEVIISNNSQLTKIAVGLFYNCITIQNVKIGDNNIARIGELAFFNCNGIKNNATPTNGIYISKSTPPIVELADANAFHEIKEETLSIFVPVANLLAYKNANNWSEYANCIES